MLMFHSSRAVNLGRWIFLPFFFCDDGLPCLRGSERGGKRGDRSGSCARSRRCSKQKKMAIEVHNDDAPVADSAASGLPRWGIAMRSSWPARQHNRPHVRAAGEGEWAKGRAVVGCGALSRLDGWMVVAGEMEKLVVIFRSRE